MVDASINWTVINVKMFGKSCEKLEQEEDEQNRALERGREANPWKYRVSLKAKPEAGGANMVY